MNQYLQEMKKALTAYHDKARQAEALIRKAAEEYKPEIARERIAEIRSRLNADKSLALDTIRNAQRNGAIEYAGRWERISGEDITPDAKLLETGISMTQDQFDGLCRKYAAAGNNTMCKLLSDFADRTNRRLALENPGVIFPPGHLMTRELPTPEINGQTWERTARAAERLIGQMEGHGITNGVDNAFVISGIEHFGEGVEL